MKNEIKLAKFLHYILGRRPDEFGLVPDAQGYILVKDLIKILHEEKWHHVCPNYLETLPYRLPDARIEVDHRRIRALERSMLPQISICNAVPKQLYTCIRRKAYTATAENGLAPQVYPDKVLLFADMELAKRVGRRRDAEPVVVTVQTTVAQGAGIQFEQFGEALYLAANIPANCCRLPAPPKPAVKKKATRESQPAVAPQPAGSFTFDWDRVSATAPLPKPTDRKSKRWRRERQRVRRLKRSFGDSS